MSEPTRYTAVGNGVVRTDPEGLLIAYGHYLELKAEVERLEHLVNYWRIESECDNARWLRCLEDLEKLRGKPGA
jgi:hypothetical protein